MWYTDQLINWNNKWLIAWQECAENERPSYALILLSNVLSLSLLKSKHHPVTPLKCVAYLRHYHIRPLRFRHRRIVDKSMFTAGHFVYGKTL